MTIPGTTVLALQQPLANFYESVQWSNPALAQMINNDIRTVALYGLAGHREKAYPAVIQLRSRAQVLSPAMIRILDHALEGLGYALDHIYE